MYASVNFDKFLHFPATIWRTLLFISAQGETLKLHLLFSIALKCYLTYVLPVTQLFNYEVPQIHYYANRVHI